VGNLRAPFDDDARPGDGPDPIPDGTEATGEVLEIQAPERFAFSFGLKGDRSPAGASRVTIRLEPHESGTRLHLLHEFDDEAVRDEFVQGWRYQLSLFCNVVSDEVNAGAPGLDDGSVWRESRRGPSADAGAHAVPDSGSTTVSLPPRAGRALPHTPAQGPCLNRMERRGECATARARRSSIGQR
jgi:hypothetical protein